MDRHGDAERKDKDARAVVELAMRPPSPPIPTAPDCDFVLGLPGTWSARGRYTPAPPRPCAPKSEPRVPNALATGPAPPTPAASLRLSIRCVPYPPPEHAVIAAAICDCRATKVRVVAARQSAAGAGRPAPEQRGSDCQVARRRRCLRRLDRAIADR